MLLGHKWLNMTRLMFTAGQFPEGMGIDSTLWDFLGLWPVESHCVPPTHLPTPPTPSKEPQIPWWV